MTPLWLATVVLLSTTAATAASGSPENVGLQSFLQAHLLDAGIAAMGGSEALGEVRTVRRQLTGDWTSAFQQPRPYAAEGPSLTMPPTIFVDEVMSFVDYAGRTSRRLTRSSCLGEVQCSQSEASARARRKPSPRASRVSLAAGSNSEPASASRPARPPVGLS